MEFRVLRYFLAVAREQSISGAAQFVHISQPTLSRQIMELEEELGVTLFHRGNRKITLTEQGMLLRKRAEQLVELVHKTEEELAANAKEESVSGTIYIGAGETHAFRALAQSIHRLAARHQDVRIHLFSGNAEDVMERLDKGLVDFGLLIEPYDVTKYDCIRLPAVDKWGVLMRKDSPLAALDFIQAKDLWNVPVIYSRQALEGGQLSSWLKIDSEKLNLVASYNLLFNASLLVEAGLGYALCLDNIVNITGESRLCFRPLSPVLESHVDLVWKKYQIFSKPSELLLEKIRGENGLQAG
jgi:DNA-binding transcriptional LysR family regulator